MTRLRPTFMPELRQAEAEVDVAVVGAGAAGIAAARRCRAAGLTCAVLEARARLGGRAVTTAMGGHPVDLGAHWLHAGGVNPLVRLGQARGEPIRRAPRSSHYVRDGAFAMRSDRAAYGRAFDRADAAFGRAARDPVDRDLAAALPPLGAWRRPISSTLALISGRPLDEVSVKDFPSEEFGDNRFVRGGYGAFVARLAGGLPIALGRPVDRIDWSGEGVVVSGGWGRVTARSVLVTAPLPVLAAGGIRFTPSLPADLSDAISTFLAGTYEHIVLNWPDAPFREPDRLAKLVSRRAAFGMLTRIDASPYHYIELDHATAAPRRGRPDELARLGRVLLAEQFGHRAIARARVIAVTDWAGDPWSRCAWAVAPPGGHRARDALARPAGGRVWFAGEANTREMWGTVGGAWEAGERAIDDVARHLAGRP